MKKILFITLAISLAGHTRSQKIYENYTRVNDVLRYGEGEKQVFPCGSKGFTLIMPDTKEELKGIVLMLDDDKIDLKDTAQKHYIQIHQQANARGFAVLDISTGIPVDLYFSSTSLIYVDSVMKEVFFTYHLPNKNIFLMGSMVSGHRALKYIEYCRSGRSVFHPAIKGVVLSESAIDWVRQWYECQKQVRDHMTDVQTFEGNFLTYLFKQNLHETPITDIQKIIDFSPYSYFDTKMEKPRLYQDLAIRAYTYADIRYWFSAPGKGVYDSNYPDMSGFINEQVWVGNKKASLIVFSSSLTDPLQKDLRKQSATWNLVDRNELMDWVVSQTK